MQRLILALLLIVILLAGFLFALSITGLVNAQTKPLRMTVHRHQACVSCIRWTNK